MANDHADETRRRPPELNDGTRRKTRVRVALCGQSRWPAATPAPVVRVRVGLVGFGHVILRGPRGGRSGSINLRRQSPGWRFAWVGVEKVDEVLRRDVSGVRDLAQDALVPRRVGAGFRCLALAHSPSDRIGHLNVQLTIRTLIHNLLRILDMSNKHGMLARALDGGLGGMRVDECVYAQACTHELTNH